MRGHLFAGACAVFVLVACGSSSSSSSSSSGGTTPATFPAASAQGKGTPNGAPVTAQIGAAGGVLATADGVLTVTVPAGAVSSDVTLSATPITNTAPGGVGTAYRLEPEGQQFAQPVTIAIKPKDGSFDLASSLVVSQRADGKWSGSASPSRDTGAKSVSVTSKHFSDWAFVTSISIDPPNAAVDPGNNRAFKATICGTEAGTEEELPSLLPTCAQDGGGATITWAVNSQPNGGGNLGTVSANGANATYTAPASNPIADTVTLSAEVTNSNNSKQIALAIIQLASKGTWVGTVEQETTQTTGTGSITIKSRADVAFRWNEGQQSYTVNGNMTYSQDTIDTAQPCEIHLTGGTALIDADGAINIFDTGAGGQKYTGGGALSTKMDATGTTTCGTPIGQQKPASTAVQGYYWFVGAPMDGRFGFDLKNDGKLMEETVPLNSASGTGTIKWSLVKQ